MRKLLLVIILIILPISGLHAQDVWKEGTHWDVECYSSIDSFIKYQFAFELSGHIEIGGVDYLKLIDLNEDQTIAYIRTERGDTVVYARYIRGQDYNEFVLYDFGSFDPGTCFQYSTWDGETWENGYPVYSLETDTIKPVGTKSCSKWDASMAPWPMFMIPWKTALRGRLGKTGSPNAAM